MCFTKKKKLILKFVDECLLFELCLYCLGNCDFDFHFCLWSHSYNFNFVWTRRRYPTFSWNTGPSRDHTSGNVVVIVVVVVIVTA